MKKALLDFAAFAVVAAFAAAGYMLATGTPPSAEPYENTPACWEASDYGDC